MRTFVLLSLVALAAAEAEPPPKAPLVVMVEAPAVPVPPVAVPPPAPVVPEVDMETKGSCVVDGIGAVSELIDSTMFIWASIERCGKDNLEIKCEIAVTSAIESVNEMINVILRAVDKCGSLNTANKECGMSAGRLTKSVAGLAAAAGGIVQKCPNAFAHQKHAPAWEEARSVTCVVELKHVATSLFKTIKVLMKVSKAKSNTATNDLQVVAALAGLGEFVAGAVGHCTVGTPNSNDLVCSEQIARLVKDVTKVSANGMDMHTKCAVVMEQVPAAPAARLFSQTDQMEADQTPTISANLMLGAFLPVTAIVSFVGGRFYGNRNSEAREVMSDVEGLE